MTTLVKKTSLKGEKKKNRPLNTQLLPLEMLDHISDAFIIYDKKWQYVFVNKKAAKILGKTQQELIGKNVWELFPNLQETAPGNSLRSVAKTKKPLYFQTYFHPLNKWFEVRIFAIKDGVATSFHDITNLKKAEQQNAQLAAIVENSFDSIWTISLENTITTWNKGAVRLYGYKASEVIGKPFDLIIPKSYVAQVKKNIQNVLAKKTVVSYESQRVTKKGNILDVSASMSPLKDITGKIIGIAFIARNITHQKEAEERLRQSEEKFRATFYQTTIPMSLSDTNGNWIVFNNAYPALFGYTEKELKAMHPKDLIHPNDLEKSKKVFSDLLTGKINHFVQERRYIHKNGSIIIGITNAAVVHDTDGKPGYMVTVIEDITERKIAEKNLKASEERFRTLIEKSSDVIQLLNKEGKVLYTSDSIKRVLGYTPEELIGQDGMPFIHPDDQQQFFTEFAKLLKNPGSQVTLEYRLKHKNGQYVWIEATGVNHLTNPAVLAIVGNFRDITQRKLLEQQKDEFLGIASHELKTPVTSLKAFNQLLQRRFMKEGDEKSVVFLSKMDSQINRLTSLIQDLLDVSKVESGRLMLRKEYFYFDELVDEIVEEIQRTTDKHTIRIAGKTKKTVYADRERIGQVLTNFLTNAIKYSPPNSKIIVHQSVKHTHIECFVKDYGIGIPKEDLPRVFDRFFRVSAKSHKTVPGMGLGLNIASEIIKRHNGNIWAKSIYTKGSSFYFSLPIEKTSSNSL